MTPWAPVSRFSRQRKSSASLFGSVSAADPARARTFATGLGFETRFHALQTPQDADSIFRDIADWRAHALVAGGPQIHAARHRIAELALRLRLPSAFSEREDADAGGLLSYECPKSEWDILDLRYVDYVDRLLRGTSPAELPVERPSRYELVINMKTAKALGLTIPKSLRLRADELAE